MGRAKLVVSWTGRNRRESEKTKTVCGKRHRAYAWPSLSPRRFLNVLYARLPSAGARSVLNLYARCALRGRRLRCADSVRSCRNSAYISSSAEWRRPDLRLCASRGPPGLGLRRARAVRSLPQSSTAAVARVNPENTIEISKFLYACEESSYSLQKYK